MKNMRKILAAITVVSTLLLATACKGDDNDSDVNDNDDVTSNCTHTFGEWSVKTNPSCTEEGVKTRVCSACGFAEEGSIDMDEHIFIQGECDVCGEPCDHSYGDWYGNTATCKEGGHEYGECDECGYVDSQATDVVAHKYENRKCIYCDKIDYTLPPQPLG